jgi:hypothetical protein
MALSEVCPAKGSICTKRAARIRIMNFRAKQAGPLAGGTAPESLLAEQAHDRERLGAPDTFYKTHSHPLELKRDRR